MHYQDPVCFIIFCDVCRVPMLVLKRHAPEPLDDELKQIERVRINRCGDLALSVSSGESPEHWHRHLDGDWTPVFMDDLPRNFIGS